MQPEFLSGRFETIQKPCSFCAAECTYVAGAFRSRNPIYPLADPRGHKAMPPPKRSIVFLIFVQLLELVLNPLENPGSSTAAVSVYVFW